MQTECALVASKCECGLEADILVYLQDLHLCVLHHCDAFRSALVAMLHKLVSLQSAEFVRPKALQRPDGNSSLLLFPFPRQGGTMLDIWHAEGCACALPSSSSYVKQPCLQLNSCWPWRTCIVSSQTCSGTFDPAVL
jgi:hypothetical protein